MYSSLINKKILSLRRIYKQLIVLTNDIFFIFSTWIAFSIGLGSVNFPNELELLVYLIATLSLLPLLLIFKVYHSIFRYGGIAKLGLFRMQLFVIPLFFT